MIEIPDETLERQFSRHFIFGSIWFKEQYQFPSTGEKRNKYLFIVVPKMDGDNCYYAFTPSNIKRYLKPPYDRDCFFIKRGSLPFFPKDTIIRLGALVLGYYSKFKDDYVNKPFEEKLEYIGQMPPDELGKIQKILHNSKDIAPRVKKQIPLNS